MPTHKFHVGQLVQFAAAISRNVPGVSYEIVKKLPEHDGEFEYRIKSMNELHARVSPNKWDSVKSGRDTSRPVAASMAAFRSHARNVNSMSTEAVRHFPELPAVLPPFPYAEITLLCAEGARD